MPWKRPPSRSATMHAAMYATALLLLLGGCGDADAPSTSDADRGPAAHDGPPTTVADDYPLTTCLVSGEPLDFAGRPVVLDFEGREVRFCCTPCIKAFHEDPAKYLAILDEAAAEINHRSR